MEKYQICLDAYQREAYGAEVLLAVDGKYAGYLLISDTVKKDAKEAVASLKRQNIFPLCSLEMQKRAPKQ